MPQIWHDYGVLETSAEQSRRNSMLLQYRHQAIEKTLAQCKKKKKDKRGEREQQSKGHARQRHKQRRMADT